MPINVWIIVIYRDALDAIGHQRLVITMDSIEEEQYPNSNFLLLIFIHQNYPKFPSPDHHPQLTNIYTKFTKPATNCYLSINYYRIVNIIPVH